MAMVIQKVGTMKKRNIIVTFFEAIYGALTPDFTEQANKSQQAYRSFRAKAQAQRTGLEKAADVITSFFGSINFAILHVFWFALWILINTGQLPAFPIFDPYPFGLLTMIVSLEAIFLSVFVLISQNRESQISDVRQELDFQINLHAEQEITKIIKMVHEIHQHLGLDKKTDRELTTMMKKLDPEKLEAEIKKEDDRIKTDAA